MLAGLAPRRKTETNTNILRNKPLVQLTPSPGRDLQALIEDRLERIKRPAEGWFFEKAIGPLSSLSPRDFQGIHEILQKTDEVRNIFSFGARSGGFELAMQFRHDINLNDSRKGLNNSSASNYLDAISLEEHSYTEKKKLDGLDVYKMQNPFWDIGYKNGIEHAKKMIFFITPEWIASPYCLQEFNWLQKTENKKIKTAFFIYKDANMNNPVIEEIHKYAETNESLVMKALTPRKKDCMKSPSAKASH
ncbi:toll/interleukin-1 receptor domain-containing protein [Paracidovorax avenae]|uniref:toll/interleukin-1 receptor domain-containing protein n=1 Tax=Paracidovorax avenae TaxID=80867 RepID=UPI001CEF5A87|nr:toll/interleukin-1 receptor domain-containing protein [Paracidovorax avenae]